MFWIIYLYYSLLWNPFARRISANFFKKFYCLHRSLETRHNRLFVSLTLLVYRAPFLSDVWLLSRRLLPSCPLLDWYRIVIFLFCLENWRQALFFRAVFPAVGLWGDCNSFCYFCCYDWVLFCWLLSHFQKNIFD